MATAKTSGATKVKTIDVMRAYITRWLHKINFTDLNPTALRQGAISHTVKKTECTKEVAAAIYNTVRREFIAAGKIAPNRLGRSGELPDTGGKWAMIGPGGAFLGTESTRKAAIAAAGPESTVGKTEELIPNG